jgi:hypothetical protein
MECCNHFQVIRCKIDKHRYELKERNIDEISLQMIDQVKAFERQYTTTNSDLTITAAATTCFKIVR